MTFAEFMGAWTLPALVSLLAGIILVLVEIFTPGVGAPGIIGSLALIFTVVLISARNLAAGMITLAVVLVIMIVAGIFIFRSFRKGRLRKTAFVLKESIDSESTTSGEKDMQELVGLEGICLNTLRPSGNADFSGRKLDVVSDGEFISKGSKVKIVRVEGLRILVQEIQ